MTVPDVPTMLIVVLSVGGISLYIVDQWPVINGDAILDENTGSTQSLREFMERIARKLRWKTWRVEIIAPMTAKKASITITVADPGTFFGRKITRHVLKQLLLKHFSYDVRGPLRVQQAGSCQLDEPFVGKGELRVGMQFNAGIPLSKKYDGDRGSLATPSDPPHFNDDGFEVERAEGYTFWKYADTLQGLGGKN